MDSESAFVLAARRRGITVNLLQPGDELDLTAAKVG
jgi:hypothetical protein